MKKLLALLLALAVSFSLAIPAFAANTALDDIEYDGYTVLSNCSDDELLAFLRENDIAIPDGLADSQEHLLELVRYFIAEIELNPNIEFIYNLAQLQDFAYALKFAVNDFYDVDSSIQPFANYGLQDSTVYQTPSNMTSYNCYAYALGRSSWCSPGELSGHGDMTPTTLKNILLNPLPFSFNFSGSIIALTSNNASLKNATTPNIIYKFSVRLLMVECFKSSAVESLITRS